MFCITTIEFDVLINRATSTLFNAQCALRQGCLLSSLLFLLVAKGLTGLLVEAKRRGDLKGEIVENDLTSTHLLFMNDILLFYDRAKRDLDSIKGALSLLEKTTGMQLNTQNFILSLLGLSKDESTNAHTLFPI